MKFAALTLSLSLGLLLTGCSGTASTQAHTGPATPIELNEIQIKGEHLLPVANDTLSGWLVVSEHTGLHWLSPGHQTLSHWQGHFSQADWRWLDAQTLVITTLDNNTSAMQVFTLDTTSGEFNSRLLAQADLADRETVCLQKSQDDFFVFSTDARGLLTHSLLLPGQGDWQITDIRTLMVGPNISSCSVADASGMLYLAEEEIGIWQYAAEPEGENTRQLDYFANAPEIESVSALSEEVYFTVATNEDRIHMRGTENTSWRVDDTLELKSISVTATSQGLQAGIYDEASHTLFAVKLPGPGVKKAPEKQSVVLTADAQTAPVNRYGDAADDPAFWINPQSPSDSLILGTDKKFGLNVYALDGSLRQTLPVGRVNNVDVRQAIQTKQGTVDIAVASNRSSQSLSVFSIDNQGTVALLDNLPTGLSDVYGLCTGLINDRLHVVVNDTDGRFQHYALDINDTTVSAQRLNEFTLPSQPEGCVIDDNTGTLYYGEESTGVWKRSLVTDASAPTLIAAVNEQVHADIEGMDIYRYEQQRYLIVSSQGNSRFAVYALDDNHRLLGTFGVAMNPTAGIDGVSETDGLAVTSNDLGPQYPNGLLVVQDGRNVMPAAPQNFKIIDGNKIAQFIQQRR